MKIFKSSLVKIIKEYGAIKVVLVSLNFLMMAGFVFLILGSFMHIWLDSLSVLCFKNLPYIPACNEIAGFGGTGIQLVIDLLISFSFSYNLLKYSVIKISISLITTCLLLVLGNWYFKHNYEKIGN